MRRLARALTLLGLLGFGGLVAPVWADQLVVGGPGDPGVGDCKPFGCADASIYQQIYSASDFSGPMTIAGLTFFLRNFDNVDSLTGQPIVPNTIYPADYTITLAVVSAGTQLSTDVESNLDPTTSSLFFAGTLNDPTPLSDHFTIQTAPANYFSYDPSLGDLLVDIRNDGTDLSLTMFLDINSASGGAFSSAFDSDPHPFGCPDGSAGITTGCVNQDSGLVTGFETPQDLAPVPEPSTVWLALTAAVLSVAIATRTREKVSKNRL